MESVDLLPPTLDVIVVISEKYPNQFRAAFKDIVSLLIGWHIDPKVPKQIGSIITDSFKRLWVTWRERLAFGLEVITDLAEDLEDDFNNQPEEVIRGRVSPRLMSLLRCCLALVQAVCFSVFESVNPDAGMVLLANPKFKVDLLQRVEQVLVLILNVGSVHFMDRLWRTMGTEFVQFLSICLRKDMVPLQLLAVQIHALEIESFSQEARETKDPNCLKFTEAWLKSLDDMISKWTIPYSSATSSISTRRFEQGRFVLDPRLLDFFVSPINSPLLSKLRLLCTRDKLAMAGIYRTCRMYIQLIQKSIVEQGPGEDGALFGPQVDTLFEIVACMYDLKCRKKALGFSQGGQADLFVEMNGFGVSLGDRMESFLNHFKTLSEGSEAAVLKHVMLADIGIVMECLANSVKGFEGVVVFACLDKVFLAPRDAEYLRHDWWVKLESSLLMEFFEMDQRLRLFGPALSVSGGLVILHIMAKLLDCASIYNHFLLGAVWFKNSVHALKRHASARDWVEAMRPSIDGIVINLVPRLDWETDHEIRILIGELLQEYWNLLGGSRENDLKLYAPVFRRLKDVHPHVQQVFVEIVASCVDPILASKVDLKNESDGVETYFKMSVMASANLGNFKWNHFEQVMKALGIHPALAVPRLDLSKTLLRLFHVCQVSKVLNQAAGLLEATKLHAFSNAYLSEDFLIFWALWECARFCLLSRLRTSFGNPEQTFGIVEAALTAPVFAKRDSKPKKFLVQFIEMLELQIHNTISGTATNLPPAPKSAVVFFHANRNVCFEWFSRIRSRIVDACANGMGQEALLIRNAEEALRDLQKVKEFDETAREAFETVVSSLGASFVSVRDSDSIVGLSKWVEKSFTWKDVNTSWMNGFKLLAENRFADGLDELNQLNLNDTHFSIMNTVLKHKALLNNGSLLNTLSLEQNSEQLLASGDILERWKDLEAQHVTTESGISALVSLALQANSMNRLPVVTSQNIDLVAVLQKAPGTLELIVREIVANISIDSSNSLEKVVQGLVQVKAARSLKDMFVGERKTEISVGLLGGTAGKVLPLIGVILKAVNPSSVSENVFQLWFSARKAARKLGCYDLAKSLARSLVVSFEENAEYELMDLIESTRLEFCVSKAPSSLVKLVEASVLDVEGQKARQKQSRALLACFKYFSLVDWHKSESERNALMDLLSPKSSDAISIQESCLTLATATAPFFGKTWLLRANFSYSRALALVDEIRTKDLNVFKKYFEVLYLQVDIGDFSFDEFADKLASIILIELDCSENKAGVAFVKGKLNDNVQSAFTFLDVPTLNIISTSLESMKANIVSLFECSVTDYFKFLETDSVNSKGDAKTTVVLRLLRLLTAYGDNLESMFGSYFAQTPLEPWLGVIPQLFSCLSHSNNSISSHVVGLLTRIAASFPDLIVYYFVVGSRSSKVNRSEPLQEMYQKIKSGLNTTYVEHISQLLDEFQRTTVLWEELWFNKLGHLNAEAPKRLHQFSVEASRMKANANVKSTITLQEKYQILLFPIVSSLEKLFKDTFDVGATTPHEIWFEETYRHRLVSSLLSLKEPADLSAVKKFWEPFVQIMNEISKDFQRNRQMRLLDLSPKLEYLSTLSIPMPVAGSTNQVLYLSGFGPVVRVLPTKTKPKKIELITSDGQLLPFLFKGLEDLRLDERIQQVLKVANNLLKTDKRARLRSLSSRTYDIFPLGDHFGMIQWVENVSQLFSIYKRWQMNYFVVRNSLNNNPGETMLRPHEMFNVKLNSSLKKHGISRNASRRDWPATVLTTVFQELSAETPDSLVRNEMWASSASSANWWTKTLSFSRSLGVNSILGYLIGLGDRHLDNIMVDFKAGEIVHIDYNVCFEKGLRLRVPEVVPFRLTQNLVGAMGICGLEGSFRISCDITLEVLQRNKDVLLALLDSFVYDPIVDWAVDEEALEDQLQQLNLNIKFMNSRISEHKDDILDAASKLQSEAAQIFRHMQSFVANTSNKALIQQEIDSLTSEMRSLGLSKTKVVAPEEEAELRDEIKRLLNDSAMWHSKHQMSLSVVTNPQLDNYLAGLNVKSNLTMGSLLVATSLETDEFDQKLLRTIQSREIHLNQLFQRIKAYQSLILPVINSLALQDLRHRIVVQLSIVGDSLEDVRNRLLLEEPDIAAKPKVEAFKTLERVFKKKSDELNGFKAKVEEYASNVEGVSRLRVEIVGLQECFAQRENYLASLLCCVVVKGVETLGSALFDLAKSGTIGEGTLAQELHVLSAMSLDLGSGSAIWSKSFGESVSTVMVVRNWFVTVKEYLGKSSSASFDADVVAPMNFLVSLSQTIEEFVWQLLGAVSSVCMLILGSSDGSVHSFMAHLEKLCLPFLMIADYKSNEFQLHSQKLRDEFNHLGSSQGSSTAGSIFSAFESVFVPLETRIQELQTLVGTSHSKEDETLRNTLFVNGVMLIYSLIESCQKYNSGHQTGAWGLEAIDFKAVVSNDSRFKDSNKRIIDFMTLAIRDALLKPALKVLSKVTPRRLVTEYVPSLATVLPAQKIGQNLKTACSSFLAGAVKEGVVNLADLETVEKLVLQLSLEMLKVSISEKGRSNVTRLEWGVGNQNLVLNRFQYLHERNLYKTCRIKNIREEILGEFQNCVGLVEKDLVELRSDAAKLNAIAAGSGGIAKTVPPAVIHTRLGLLKDEIARISTVLDICQGLTDFEISRTPSPLSYTPIQTIVSVLTKLETLQVRKSPTRERYAKVIQFLTQKQEQSFSNDKSATPNAKVIESMETLLRLYETGKSSLKRLHSAVDRVARGSQNVAVANNMQKKLKLFWAHWPHLGSKIRKWVQETRSLIETSQLTIDDLETLIKKSRWLFEGVAESIKVFTDLLNQVSEIKGVSSSTSVSVMATVDETAIEEDEAGEEDSDSESDDEEDDEEGAKGIEEGGGAGGSQKAQTSAAREFIDKKEAQNAAVPGMERERNAHALSILRRVQEKLDGMDGVKHSDGGQKARKSVQEQVEMVIQQATSVENLSRMYEGWMSWI
ncbi:UNVERIFIED_CONTAM: hypothetical protein HDU68_008315 [Siphonaria sp. JEL0065]|nr:hypothetical protein HDU68_008315 [Siphonaria sp. JEL0065]